jgi:hypothetical protein
VVITTNHGLARRHIWPSQETNEAAFIAKWLRDFMKVSNFLRVASAVGLGEKANISPDKSEFFRAFVNPIESCQSQQLADASGYTCN